MVVAVSPQTKMSLQDLLQFDPQNELNYELEEGKLKEMPPESDLNRRIAMFLVVYFARLGISVNRLSQKTEIAVTGSKESVRVPDLMVLSEEAAISLENATRSTIMPDMPAPELVIEVVSPGQANITRDYRHKRAQYQARGINEYWIVDPLEQKITILTLNEYLYDEAVFQGEQAIASSFLKTLTPDPSITVAEILQNAPN
jgi:Uma2 family endonuclease